MRGSNRFDRSVFVQIGALVVGEPTDMLPEMGLQPADDAVDSRLTALALADAGIDGGWTHVYIFNGEQTTMLAGMLCERLSNDEFDRIVEARAAAEAEGTAIVLPGDTEVRSFGGRGSNGDLAG